MARLKTDICDIVEVTSVGQPNKRRVCPASCLLCCRPISSKSDAVIRDSMPTDPQQLNEEADNPWGELPEHLLQLIFSKVETTRVQWESVKTLYAASGVCRKWRTNALPLVLHGLWEKPSPLDLIHPVQLFSLSPYEEGNLIKCYITRQNISGTLGSSVVRFNLFLEPETAKHSTKFLLSATQHTWQQTSIYLNQSGSGIPCAKLTSGVLGTTHKLTRCPASIFPEATSELSIGTSIPLTDSLVSVKYKLRMKGMMRPRRLNVLLPMPADSLEIESRHQSEKQSSFLKKFTRSARNAHSMTDISTHRSERTIKSKSFLSRSSGDKRIQSVPHMKLVNKPPHWNDGLKCWCLNFRGRVKLASVKNFQLISTSDKHGKVVMQFGKVDANTFILDFNPSRVSAVQAFSIALTSFEGRVLL